MIQLYGLKFMGDIDPIYIPINEDSVHWYLMVVDLFKEEIIVLDSFPSRDQARSRLMKVRTVAIFLERMLKDRFFWQVQSPVLVPVAEFPVLVPEGLPVQNSYSNDCGIYVASWMINHSNDNYMVEVDDGTQLRLALDMLLKSHNVIREEVKHKGFEHIK